MKNCSGFILFFIAQITTPIFNLVGMMFAVLTFKGFSEANKYFGNLAYSKDQHSNVAMQHLFNMIMLKEINGNKPYLYGNPDETISSVFGKNQRLETLTRFGRFWNRFLSKIEKDHSLLSIEEDETHG